MTGQSTNAGSTRHAPPCRRAFDLKGQITFRSTFSVQPQELPLPGFGNEPRLGHYPFVGLQAWVKRHDGMKDSVLLGHPAF